MLNGIYYESGIGDCYIENSGNTASKNTCDFKSGTNLPKGLDIAAQNMIDKEVVWNLGGSASHNEVTVKLFYEKERGKSTGSSNTYPTQWSQITDIGNRYNGIGLIYPSDYGYATNGGSIGRESCFNEYLYNWNSINVEYQKQCANNSWLKPNSGYPWTLSPYSSNSSSSFDINFLGFVNAGSVYIARGVWPTLYLKSNVKIVQNSNSELEYGSKENPFILE